VKLKALALFGPANVIRDQHAKMGKCVKAANLRAE
jgi:hypothetical protein